MDGFELDFVLKKGEGQFVEFKESFDSKNLSRELVAFANAQGGRILMGVSDEGVVKGIDITNKLKSDILTIARNCDPPVRTTIEVFENILIVNVHEGSDKPYSCSQGFFLRMGATSQKLSRDEILDFSFSEGRITFDEQLNKTFDFEDFDDEKLNE